MGMLIMGLGPCYVLTAKWHHHSCRRKAQITALPHRKLLPGISGSRRPGEQHSRSLNSVRLRSMMPSRYKSCCKHRAFGPAQKSTLLTIYRCSTSLCSSMLLIEVCCLGEQIRKVAVECLFLQAMDLRRRCDVAAHCTREPLRGICPSRLH